MKPRYLINTKKLRVYYNLIKDFKSFFTLGFIFDNYRKSGGPIELTLCLIFLSITIDIGPDFKD